MRKIEFWIRASNYSIVVVAMALILKMFFRKHLINVIVPILFVGGIAFIVFMISELMKFIIRRRQ